MEHRPDGIRNHFHFKIIENISRHISEIVYSLLLDVQKAINGGKKSPPQFDLTGTAVCAEPHSPHDGHRCIRPSKQSSLEQEDPSPPAGSAPVNCPVLAGHLPHALEAVANSTTAFITQAAEADSQWRAP